MNIDFEKCYGLCKGRHALPVENYIFDNIENPLDIAELYETANSKIPQVPVLNLITTGLSTALLAVVRACVDQEIALVVWHYDTSTGNYISQVVLPEIVQKIEAVCPFCGAVHDLDDTYCPNCGAT